MPRALPLGHTTRSARLIRWDHNSAPERYAQHLAIVRFSRRLRYSEGPIPVTEHAIGVDSPGRV